VPKVLIAEDDLMIADMIEASLIDNGYQVTGIARTVAQGVSLGRQMRPDFAILDMRLADNGLGTEVAAQLRDGPRIGFLYASANINQVKELANCDACIAKPYDVNDLMRGLMIVERIVGGDAELPPFPRGFHLLGASRLAVGEPTND
jgi:DNA-binding response OmpR family regulator